MRGPGRRYLTDEQAVLVIRWNSEIHNRYGPGTAPALALDFVAAGGGMLAVTHRPRVRSLPAMKSLGATHLVTVLSPHEGARVMGSAATAAGLEWIWVDLANGDLPPPARDGELAGALFNVDRILRDGAGVVIHCSAGIHRTGMFAYALLRATGMDAESAKSALVQLRTSTAEAVGEHRLEWADRLCTTMGWASTHE